MQHINMKNDLLLRQENPKRLHALEADIITIKKHWFDASTIIFSQDVFQMTAIASVSVINYYQIKGLHLFWDTLYITFIFF